jgi:AraC-like DNA-binding protein
LEHSFSPRAHILSVHFLCQWPSGENLIDNRETVMVKSERHPALEASARKMEQLLRESFPEEGAREQTYGEQSSDYEGFLRFQGLFLEWLAVWSKVCLENGGQLTRLISGDSRPFHAARCLNEARLDQPFPAEWLQRETGLGLLRLNQLFFKEFGLTTRKYWDRRRLDFAKQCLETSEMPLKEISYRIGFRSSSHFVIWFRRVVKLRPGEWRKNYRTRHADLAMRS